MAGLHNLTQLITSPKTFTGQLLPPLYYPCGKYMLLLLLLRGEWDVTLKRTACAYYACRGWGGGRSGQTIRFGCVGCLTKIEYGILYAEPKTTGASHNTRPSDVTFRAICRAGPNPVSHNLAPFSYHVRAQIEFLQLNKLEQRNGTILFGIHRTHTVRSFSCDTFPGIWNLNLTYGNDG